MTRASRDSELITRGSKKPGESAVDVPMTGIIPQKTESLDPSKLVGTWTLRSHTTYRSGSRTATGANAQGLITYTSDGMMMVAITFDEGRIDLRRNIFYGGSFRIEGNTIVHEVIVSNAEQQVGKLLRREARLEGTTLALFAGDHAEGAEIVWEKKDHS